MTLARRIARRLVPARTKRWLGKELAPRPQPGETEIRAVVDHLRGRVPIETLPSIPRYCCDGPSGTFIAQLLKCVAIVPMAANPFWSARSSFLSDLDSGDQMAKQVPQRRRVAFLFSNRQPGPVQLTVEPWAIELMVPADRLAKVEFEGPGDIVVEVRTEPGRLTVYGWEGSSIASPLPQLLDRAQPT